MFSKEERIKSGVRKTTFFLLRKKEEGRRKKEEGRRKKEEGRRKKSGKYLFDC